MPPNPHRLMVSVGAAALLVLSALLAQPTVSQAQSANPYRAHRGYYHRHHVSEYQWRYVRATIEEIANSPFYGPFGNYYDAAAASQYTGPNQRRFFGYGQDF